MEELKRQGEIGERVWKINEGNGDRKEGGSGLDGEDGKDNKMGRKKEKGRNRC